MVTGCPDRPEHRTQISHRDATLRPNLSPKLHARQPKLVYSELFRASLDIKELGASVFQPGTIVFPKVGAAIATNKKRILDTPAAIDNNLVGVTAADKRKCNARYLYRWIESINLSEIANVSAVPSINGSRLKSVLLLLPPLPEQRAIANILDSIDHAIESTDALVFATEQLRDSLLHNLLTHGLPGRHTEWKEVPGLGTIPSDWQAAHLGSHSERITKGTTPTTLGQKYTLSGVRFLRVENISNGGTISGGGLRFIDEETHHLLSRSILKDNDLLFSIAGALGRSALISSNILPANVNQALAIVRLGDRSAMLPAFLSQVLRGQSVQVQVNDMRTELAQANISLQ